MRSYQEIAVLKNDITEGDKMLKEMTEKCEKLKYRNECLVESHDNDKLRSIRYKRKYEETMDKKDLMEEKLTTALALGERYQRRIVELEEKERKLEQKALIESAVQSALTEDRRERKFEKDRCIIMLLCIKLGYSIVPSRRV